MVCGVMMYKLTGNPILLPHQIQILKLFFGTSFAKPFFLTGGTALSAFYLAHRESQDLDFFSLQPFDTYELQATFREIATITSSEMSLHVRSPSYNELFLENKRAGWMQKIDIIHEQPVHFDELVSTESIVVDSLVNIATNKVLAVFGRLDPKDYIDLFLICTKTELQFDDLFELAKQNDKGLTEFYFAHTITQAETFTTFPTLKLPFAKEEFTRFYDDISRKLLLKIKPIQ